MLVRSNMPRLKRVSRQTPAVVLVEGSREQRGRRRGASWLAVRGNYAARRFQDDAVTSLSSRKPPPQNDKCAKHPASLPCLQAAQQLPRAEILPTTADLLIQLQQEQEPAGVTQNSSDIFAFASAKLAKNTFFDSDSSCKIGASADPSIMMPPMPRRLLWRWEHLVTTQSKQPHHQLTQSRLR